MDLETKRKKLEELKKKASDLKKEVDYYNALQLALKLVLNGSYGAFATPYFILFNNNVASTITSQGRELTKTMDIDNRYYWNNLWHIDYELHKKMCISGVKKINEDLKTSIYADTDSVSGDTIIPTDRGDIKIEEWYNESKTLGESTIVGHESKTTRDKILNWNDDLKELEMVPVKRIIRHRVTKPKWQLKSKSGKVINITDCHSLIVFRNGIRTRVKPEEVNILTDKILVSY